jgi:ABC-type methionine transport system permease subunit
MELIILAGLALFILFAATADMGEAEVETFIITRPVSRQRTFPMLILTVMLALLIVMVVGRMATVAGL